MMTRPARGTEEILPELLHQLCVINARDGEQVTHLYRHCLTLIGCDVAASGIPDEFKLCERIQKKLVLQHKERDALRFTELHRRLKSQVLVSRCPAILQFLLTLSSETAAKKPILAQDSLLSDVALPSSLLPTSSRTRMKNGHGSAPPHGFSKGTSRHEYIPDPATSYESSGTSGLGSTWRSDHSMRGLAMNHSVSGSVGQRSAPNVMSSSLLGRPGSKSAAEKTSGEAEVSERTLLADLMFACQGIDGRYIQFSASADAYRLNYKITVNSSLRSHCHKIAELGWLFQKIRKYIDTRSLDPSYGLVVQSFCSALLLELTEYYRLVAVLEAQLSSDQSRDSDSLTLRRLVVWTREPLKRLKTLAVLVDACRRLRGGALVSKLFTFTQHGDPEVKKTVQHILNQVYRPINSLLNSWIFDGQMKDQYSEFFIAADLKVSNERLWQSKYSIRNSMLPKFISQDLAQKILIVGKSINFLRRRCHDNTQLFSNAQRSWFLTEAGDSSFQSMTGPSLETIVTITYTDTSRHLLDVLNRTYSFGEHLMAMRRYLLLGQGDFVQHLMDLLHTELSQAASSLYLHNLTAVLESAVRATNAQYDDQDVLNRLDVKMLDLSPGDKGWDVFSLNYHVDGPINTVFTPEAMTSYLTVFNFLWRAKRIEFCLAGMWRNQMNYQRQLAPLPELHPTLHHSQLLTAALVHFTSQLQYYIMFECLECCWDKLLRETGAAGDLDQVIAAHNEFLTVVTTHCLLDRSSQMLLTQLRTLFDLVVDFQGKQEAMFDAFLAEAKLRKQFSALKSGRAEQGEWGVTQRQMDEEYERREEFYKTHVVSFRSQFTVIEQTYTETLQSFLEKLEDHSEENLQFLARRLDFNRFYRDPDTSTV